MTEQQLRLKANLITRCGKYHVALSWYDVNGERQRTTVATGYQVEVPKDYLLGKIRYKAEVEARRKMIEREKLDELLSVSDADRILFADWMIKWLEYAKTDNGGNPLRGTTLYNYGLVINNSIIPYFKPKGLPLSAIDHDTLQSFYDYKVLTDGVSRNTTKHYHACIRRALMYAMEQGLIAHNPAATFIMRKEKHVPNYYGEAELKQFVDAVRGTELEAPIYIASSLALRRGEILGVRWSAIDFEHGILYIRGEVLELDANGHNLHYEDHAKTEDSIRSFWLSPDQVEYLQRLKAEQDARREAPGYNHDWDDFVCCRNNGDIIKPYYLSAYVPRMTVRCGLPRLRLHELRHTVISLLLLNGYQLKEVSEFAGHSNISTTSDIYGHLPPITQRRLTSTMGAILSQGKPQELSAK